MAWDVLSMKWVHLSDVDARKLDDFCTLSPFDDEDAIFYSDIDDLDVSATKKDRKAHHSLQRSRKVVLDYARANVFSYFCTFTFNPDVVDRYSYRACYDKLRYWLKRMYKSIGKFKYVIVPEQHKDGAWHFHGLFSSELKSELVFSGHYVKGSSCPIYNISSYDAGFTNVTEIFDRSKTANYIVKYLTKGCIEALPSDRRVVLASHNLDTPKRYRAETDADLEEISTIAESIGCFVQVVKGYYSSINLFLTKSEYESIINFINLKNVNYFKEKEKLHYE